MQRITVTIDEELAQEIDRLAQMRGYQNKSETIRDLIRAGIVHTSSGASSSDDCIASVIYVFDRDTRDLPKRLSHAYQDQHDLSVATMRITLDHDSSMEISVLKGKRSEVEHFAEHIIAERGIRHGRVVMIPARLENERHSHGHRQAHAHQHIKVK